MVSIINYHSFKKEIVDSIIMAIVLCQIHVQEVDYIEDNQVINSLH